MAFIIKPPLPPMESRSVDEIPNGDDWQYEPKWDGFRCIAFRNGENVYLQSKAGQPLARYFPDVVEAIVKLRSKNFVLDGELAIPINGALSFDELQLRLHPAASRVAKLAKSHPAIFVVFESLHHVGFTSAFTTDERRALTKKFEALRKPPGFTGNAPGGPSRWSTERTGEWEPVDPKIVVEVAYDHFTGGRFRHGTKILRWRKDKAPKQCTLDQVEGREGKSLALL